MTTDSSDPGQHEPGEGTSPRTEAGTAAQPAGRTSATADASRGPGRPGGDGPPPAGPPAPPPRPRGGRLLAFLALLVALAALGGAGYLYYELIHQGEVRAVAEQVESLNARFGEVDEQFQQMAERQQAELSSFRERQAAARAETERALRESLSEVARQAPPSTSEWRRAEARYLLRIANHRLLMERDVEGALRLLEAADTVLAELDDFALHEVRARLADEIAALEAVDGTDLQGLFLRLEAAKRQLDQLPLRMPEYLRSEPEPEPTGEGDVWSELRRQLAGMIDFRRLDSEVKPLLAPEEGLYLELNLRLMLERAQLAAVRREQMIFEESLATAIDWIHDYLDTNKAAVQRLLSELQSLQQVDLAQPLPDISGSLQALRDVLRNPA